jgi:hypothetical protein
MAAPLDTCTTIEQRGVVRFLWAKNMDAVKDIHIIVAHMAHEGGKVVSPKDRQPLPPRKYNRYSFLLEAESTPGP